MSHRATRLRMGPQSRLKDSTTSSLCRGLHWKHRWGSWKDEMAMRDGQPSMCIKRPMCKLQACCEKHSLASRVGKRTRQYRIPTNSQHPEPRTFGNAFTPWHFQPSQSTHRWCCLPGKPLDQKHRHKGRSSVAGQLWVTSWLPPVH